MEFTPNWLLKKNDQVKLETLYFIKNSERVKFVSPVSGKIKEIIRGDRRRVLEIKIKSDGKDSYRKLSKISDSDPDEIINFMLILTWPL